MTVKFKQGLEKTLKESEVNQDALLHLLVRQLIKSLKLLVAFYLVFLVLTWLIYFQI